MFFRLVFQHAGIAKPCIVAQWVEFFATSLNRFTVNWRCSTHNAKAFYLRIHILFPSLLSLSTSYLTLNGLFTTCAFPLRDSKLCRLFIRHWKQTVFFGTVVFSRGFRTLIERSDCNCKRVTGLGSQFFVWCVQFTRCDDILTDGMSNTWPTRKAWIPPPLDYCRNSIVTGSMESAWQTFYRSLEFPVFQDLVASL